MPHEIDRLIEAVGARPWAIDEHYAREIIAVLQARAATGPRAAPFTDTPATSAEPVETMGKTAVLRLHGMIAPRASAVQDISTPFASLERFGSAFRALSADSSVTRIVLDIDSPGGMVDLVPETAAMIRAARKPSRPIVAVANTLAASAAYWIASQADEFYASPSATVGSIGVRAMHVDQSVRDARNGVKVTHISAGARKTEMSPHAPLDRSARQALQTEINAAYDAFVADVAAARGIAEAVVRADPERADAHMGGGRSYNARRALALNMVDGIATLDEALAKSGGGRSARAERERLALL